MTTHSKACRILELTENSTRYQQINDFFAHLLTRIPFLQNSLHYLSIKEQLFTAQEPLYRGEVVHLALESFLSIALQALHFFSKWGRAEVQAIQQSNVRLQSYIHNMLRLIQKRSDGTEIIADDFFSKAHHLHRIAYTQLSHTHHIALHEGRKRLALVMEACMDFKYVGLHSLLQHVFRYVLFLEAMREIVLDVLRYIHDQFSKYHSHQAYYKKHEETLRRELVSCYETLEMRSLEARSFQSQISLWKARCQTVANILQSRGYVYLDEKNRDILNGSSYEVFLRQLMRSPLYNYTSSSPSQHSTETSFSEPDENRCSLSTERIDYSHDSRDSDMPNVRSVGSRMSIFRHNLERKKESVSIPGSRRSHGGYARSRQLRELRRGRNLHMSNHLSRHGKPHRTHSQNCRCSVCSLFQYNVSDTV